MGILVFNYFLTFLLGVWLLHKLLNFWIQSVICANPSQRDPIGIKNL